MSKAKKDCIHYVLITKIYRAAPLEVPIGEDCDLKEMYCDCCEDYSNEK